MKTKILFLIHDLSVGGAEKVLVNLVNNMDRTKFDTTVMTLFDQGINKQFLAPHIKYKTCFSKAIPGNSHLMKILSPARLHKWLIKDKYDIEVAYLEGPSARVVSGCPNNETKLVCWIHIEQKTTAHASRSFRSTKEAIQSYNRYNKIITVSETVKEDFTSILPITTDINVLYNTNETNYISSLAKEEVEDICLCPDTFNIIGVGKLVKNKGFHRLLCIQKRLLEEGYRVHVYILGIGPEEENLKRYALENGMSNAVTLLGYNINPYKYVAKCDLFVCSSYAEGFSTATTEALIVGTPVCTVEVSGMREMLGDNEYGIITKNDDNCFYEGIKQMIDDPYLLDHYRKKAYERGAAFSTQNTVSAVEKMLLSL